MIPKELEKVNSNPLAFFSGYIIGRFIVLYSAKTVKDCTNFIIGNYSKVGSNGINKISKRFNKFFDEIDKQL